VAPAAKPARKPATAKATSPKPIGKLTKKSNRPKTGPIKPTVSSADDYDQMRIPLPDLQFSYAAPTSGAAALQQLGVPLGWTDARSPAELLGPIVAATAAFAQRVATADPQTAAVLTESPDLVSRRKVPRRNKR
jgi:hypothetical protein